ncbi:hypothetical protein D9M72_409570 [compost metagenome]
MRQQRAKLHPAEQRALERRRSRRLHRDRRGQRDDLSKGPESTSESSEYAEECSEEIDVGIVGEDEEWETVVVAEEPRHVNAEPGSRHAADDYSNQGDDGDEFHIVGDNAGVEVPERLEQTKLLAFERDQSAECQVDEEGADDEEDRRKRAAHVSEHVEPVLEIGMRGLVLASVGSAAAVRLEHIVERIGDFRLHGIRHQLEAHRGERALQTEDLGQSALRHPDYRKATIIGHPVAGADRIDILRRQCDADDRQLTLAAVERGGETVTWLEAVRLRKALVDHHLLQIVRARQTSVSHVEPLEQRGAAFGQRDEAPGRRFAELRDVEKRKLGDPGFDHGDARNLGDARDERLRSSCHLREDVSELVALVVGGARLIQRPERSGRQHKGCDAAGDHQGDGEDLSPEPPQVPPQFGVQRSHCLTRSVRRLRAAVHSPESLKSIRRQRRARGRRRHRCWRCG